MTTTTQRVKPLQPSSVLSSSDHRPTVVLCSSKDDYILSQDICTLCGSLGKSEEGNLISCSQCGQCYHPFCVNIKGLKVVISKGWRCLECTVCETCGQPGDEAKLLLCDECELSCHTYCLDPPLEDVPQGPWKCHWCVMCLRCGATSPGTKSDWQKNYTECGPCSSFNTCPKCKIDYNQNDLIIQCRHCSRWLHALCDSIKDEDECELASKLGYTCLLCRPKNETPRYLVHKNSIDSVSQNNSSSNGANIASISTNINSLEFKTNSQANPKYHDDIELQKPLLSPNYISNINLDFRISTDNQTIKHSQSDFPRPKSAPLSSSNENTDIETLRRPSSSIYFNSSLDIPEHLDQTDNNINKPGTTLNDNTLYRPFDDVDDEDLFQGLHMVDGIYLSATGFNFMKSQKLEPPKRQRAKRGLKIQKLDEFHDDMNRDDDEENKLISDDKLDDEGRRKRIRKLSKVGIGGFTVRQRGVRINKDEDSTYSLNNDINEANNSPSASIMNQSATCGTSESSTVANTKPKRIRKKPRKKTNLIDHYPAYLQEAFFGRDLLSSKILEKVEEKRETFDDCSKNDLMLKDSLEKMVHTKTTMDNDSMCRMTSASDFKATVQIAQEDSVDLFVNEVAQSKMHTQPQLQPQPQIQIPTKIQTLPQPQPMTPMQQYPQLQASPQLHSQSQSQPQPQTPAPHISASPEPQTPASLQPTTPMSFQPQTPMPLTPQTPPILQPPTPVQQSHTPSLLQPPTPSQMQQRTSILQQNQHPPQRQPHHGNQQMVIVSNSQQYSPGPQQVARGQSMATVRAQHPQQQHVSYHQPRQQVPRYPSPAPMAQQAMHQRLPQSVQQPVVVNRQQMTPPQAQRSQLQPSPQYSPQPTFAGENQQVHPHSQIHSGHMHQQQYSQQKLQQQQMQQHIPYNNSNQNHVMGQQMNVRRQFQPQQQLPMQSQLQSQPVQVPMQHQQQIHLQQHQTQHVNEQKATCQSAQDDSVDIFVTEVGQSKMLTQPQQQILAQPQPISQTQSLSQPQPMTPMQQYPQLQASPQLHSQSQSQPQPQTPAPHISASPEPQTPASLQPTTPMSFQPQTPMPLTPQTPPILQPPTPVQQSHTPSLLQPPTPSQMQQRTSILQQNQHPPQRQPHHGNQQMVIVSNSQQYSPGPQQVARGQSMATVRAQHPQQQHVSYHQPRQQVPRYPSPAPMAQQAMHQRLPQSVQQPVVVNRQQMTPPQAQRSQLQPSPQYSPQPTFAGENQQVHPHSQIHSGHMHQQQYSQQKLQQQQMQQHIPYNNSNQNHVMGQQMNVRRQFQPQQQLPMQSQLQSQPVQVPMQHQQQIHHQQHQVQHQQTLSQHLHQQQHQQHHLQQQPLVASPVPLSPMHTQQHQQQQQMQAPVNQQQSLSQSQPASQLQYNSKLDLDDPYQLFEDEDDLKDLGADFNILEYADPEPDKSASTSSGKNNIELDAELEDYFDERETLDEKRLNEHLLLSSHQVQPQQQLPHHIPQHHQQPQHPQHLQQQQQHQQPQTQQQSQLQQSPQTPSQHRVVYSHISQQANQQTHTNQTFAESQHQLEMQQRTSILQQNQHPPQRQPHHGNQQMVIVSNSQQYSPGPQQVARGQSMATVRAQHPQQQHVSYHQPRQQVPRYPSPAPMAQQAMHQRLPQSVQQPVVVNRQQMTPPQAQRSQLQPSPQYSPQPTFAGENQQVHPHSQIHSGHMHQQQYPQQKLQQQQMQQHIPYNNSNQNHVMGQQMNVRRQFQPQQQPPQQIHHHQHSFQQHQQPQHQIFSYHQQQHHEGYQQTGTQTQGSKTSNDMMMFEKNSFVGEAVTSIEFSLHEQGSGSTNEAVNLPMQSNESTNIVPSAQERTIGSISENQSLLLNQNRMTSGAMHLDQVPTDMGVSSSSQRADMESSAHLGNLKNQEACSLEKSDSNFKVTPMLGASRRLSSSSSVQEVENSATSGCSAQPSSSDKSTSSQPQNQLLKQLLGNCSSADNPNRESSSPLLIDCGNKNSIPAVGNNTLSKQMPTGIQNITLSFQMDRNKNNNVPVSVGNNPQTLNASTKTTSLIASTMQPQQMPPNVTVVSTNYEVKNFNVSQQAPPVVNLNMPPLAVRVHQHQSNPDSKPVVHKRPMAQVVSKVEPIFPKFNQPMLSLIPSPASMNKKIKSQDNEDNSLHIIQQSPTSIGLNQTTDQSPQQIIRAPMKNSATKRKNDYIAERRAALEKEKTPPPKEIKPKKRVRGPNKRSRIQIEGNEDLKTLDSNSNASDVSQQPEFQIQPTRKRVCKPHNKVGKSECEEAPDSLLSSLAIIIHSEAMLPIEEPEIEVNNNINSLFSCGDLNQKYSKLRGHFGKAFPSYGTCSNSLQKRGKPEIVGYYHEVFPVELDGVLHDSYNNCTLLKTLERDCDSPSSIISASSHDFEDSSNGILELTSVKENRPGLDLFTLNTLSNQQQLKSSSEFSAEESTSTHKMDLNNNSRTLTPTIPINIKLPMTYMPVSAASEPDQGMDESNKENLIEPPQSSAPTNHLQLTSRESHSAEQTSTSLNMRLRDHGNVSVTLTLTNKEADGVKRVLNSLSQLIDYPIQSSFIMDSTVGICQQDDKTCFSNSFRLFKGTSQNQAISSPSSHKDLKFNEENYVCTNKNESSNKLVDIKPDDSPPDIKPEFCCSCKAIIVDRGIRKKLSEIPESTKEHMQRMTIISRDQTGELVFCSVRCYAASMTYPYPKREGAFLPWPQGMELVQVRPLKPKLKSLSNYESLGCESPEEVKMEDDDHNEVQELYQDTRRCVFCHELGDGESDGPGRLLNLSVDKWIHLNCALWSSDVYELANGALMNVELAHTKSVTCSFCHRPGATLKCFTPRCMNFYHFPCATKEKCSFYEDKSVLCVQHSKGAIVKELNSFIVKRRVYVHRDEQKQVAEMIQEEQQSVLRIGSLVFLNIGQLLPHQLIAFHDHNNIFPVGYRVIRYYWSYRRFNKRVKYVCSIQENDGKPQFRIIAQEYGLEDQEFLGDTPHLVWSQIIDMIVDLRKQVPDTITTFPAYIRGEDLFGLTEPSIVRILESLPGVEALTDYEFKFGRSPFLELPLAINPTGCARTEPKLRTHFKRPYTIHTASSIPKSRLQSLTSGDTTSPYIKQFVHSKSSQYRKMKSDWRSNVVLARSRVQGLGLYAARDIEKNTMVIEYIGMLIRNEIAERYERIHEAHNRGIYMFRLDDERVIDATLAGGLARYINHSCNPNCYTEAIEVDRERKIVITTSRKILKGEELAYDYKLNIEDDQHKISCLCGAATCKKWMN